MDVGHVVGEVELVVVVEGASAGIGSGDDAEKWTLEHGNVAVDSRVLDSRTLKFMHLNAWAFPVEPRPVGKLTAYFAHRRAIETAGWGGQKHRRYKI